MTSSTDKLKGKANVALGEIKQAAGNVIGNPTLQMEGAAQKLKGKAQVAVGKTKEAAKDMIDKV